MCSEDDVRERCGHQGALASSRGSITTPDAPHRAPDDSPADWPGALVTPRPEAGVEARAATRVADDAEPAWPALRRAIGALQPGARPGELSLDRWLCAGSAAGSVVEGLAPARALAAELRALGLEPGPAGGVLLELAFLSDCLDPAAPASSAAALAARRGALVEGGGGPCDHAAALLDGTGRTHLALLGRPGCAAAIRRAALTLGEVAGERAAPLVEAIDRQVTGLQLGGLAALVTLPDPVTAVAAALDRALSMGRPALDLRGRCRAAWDVNRTALDRYGELVGDLFEPLVVLDAAHRAGIDVRRLVAAVTRARAGRPVRYFRDCDAMPEDADDAAAVIVCARTAGAVPDALASRARAVLEAALTPAGSVSTWVSLADRPGTMPFAHWTGAECEGVAGRALRALSLDRAAWPPGTADRLASWLASRAGPDGGFSSAYYPSRALATSLVVEGLAAARDAGELDERARRSLDGAVRWLLGLRRSSGAFGDTVLETAAAALALEAARALSPPCAAEVVAALASSQRNDGTWPPAACYLTASPGGELRPAGSALLSTAFALAALVACRRDLTTSEPGCGGSVAA